MIDGWAERSDGFFFDLFHVRHHNTNNCTPMADKQTQQPKEQMEVADASNTGSSGLNYRQIELIGSSVMELLMFAGSSKFVPTLPECAHCFHRLNLPDDLCVSCSVRARTCVQLVRVPIFYLKTMSTHHTLLQQLCSPSKYKRTVNLCFQSNSDDID